MLTKLLFRFSTGLKSDLTIWNNNTQIYSGQQCMMTFISNPTIYINQVSNSILMNPGYIGMHLVQTQRRFMKGVERYQFFLKLNEITCFSNYQMRSDNHLGLVFNPPECNESKNLNLRFLKQIDTTFLTFFDLYNNKVNKIKKLTLGDHQLLLMQELFKQSMNDVSGMDLKYCLENDQNLDKLVQQNNQKLENSNKKQEQNFEQRQIIQQSYLF